MAGLKVTLVLDPADADLIATALDEYGLSGDCARHGHDWMRAWELRDKVRSARRHRHGRVRT